MLVIDNQEKLMIDFKCKYNKELTKLRTYYSKLAELENDVFKPLEIPSLKGVNYITQLQSEDNAFYSTTKTFCNLMEYLYSRLIDLVHTYHEKSIINKVLGSIRNLVVMYASYLNLKVVYLRNKYKTDGLVIDKIADRVRFIYNTLCSKQGVYYKTKVKRNNSKEFVHSTLEVIEMLVQNTKEVQQKLNLFTRYKIAIVQRQNTSMGGI